MTPRLQSTGSKVAVRCAAIGVALSVLSGPTGAAAQADPQGEEIKFDYAVDGVSWYWVHQIEETLELGTVVHPVELPNPQATTTMPVAVDFGDPSKVAALQFNLAERGVPEGSTITQFELTVAEGDDAQDSPTFNPAGHLIQACPITEAWSSGKAEMWDVQPPVGDDCVVGERAEPDPEEVAEAEKELEAIDAGEVEDPQIVEVPKPTWSFDLTELAADWGTDPFANFGVMFMPVMKDATAVDIWQVNLKLPLRDDPQTPIDEYEATADRLTATMAYVPGEPEDESSEAPVDTAPVGNSGGTGGTSGGGGSSSGGAGGGGGGDGAADEITPAAYEPPEPRMPWYVWALIPGGLVAAYVLHTVMGGSGAAATGNGAIERIRSHNLDRRGFSLAVPAGLFERLTGRGKGA